MSDAKIGWEIHKATVSPRNGGLYVEGVNHETQDALGRNIFWDIGHHSIDDCRYDWTNCAWGPGAKECYDRLVKQCEESLAAWRKKR
jgi:hypothetical protein